MTNTTNSREIVLDILLEVLERGALSHLVLKQALEKYQYLEKQERAFITRVTEGTIERVLLLDAAIGRFSKVKVNKMKPVIRTLLRMSAYQILFLERVPDSAVCNEAVKLAKKRKFDGLSGFVNGVLRNISREKENLHFEEPEIRYSMPRWILSMWERDYGREAAESMAASFLKERPLSVRCNVSQASLDQIKKSLEDQKIGVRSSEFSENVLFLSGYDYLEQVEAFRKGWISVQDPSSALVCTVCGPEVWEKEDPMVLDVCSAPGGKSLHAADCLHGKGLVEARDLTEYKIGLVEENRDRCGFTNLRTKVWDATLRDEAMEEKADLLLADLPCSGLGIIGKKPDIKLRLQEEEVESLAALQRQILSAVSAYVKPGGVMVFSTCTVNKRENDENARWVLENLPFKKKDIREFLPECLREKMKSGQENQIQLFPGDFSCDGFFIAAFERI